MHKRIYGLRDLTNEAVVEVIRRKFLLEAETNKHLYHSIDVERCRSEDWQIERFLLEKGTPDEALKALVRAIQWKKSFGVHERNRQYFPREMTLIFGNQMFSKDKQGRLCYWGNTIKYKKISELNFLFKQFNSHVIEVLDRAVGNRGYISVSDWKDASLNSIDMSIVKFSSSLWEYYPQLLQLGIIMDIPWLLVPLSNIIKSFSSRRSKNNYLHIKREELKDHIDIDDNELPVSYGGNREIIYDITDDMLPLIECKHLGLNDKQIDNFYKVYNFDK